jgi:hypothetical protein
MTVMADPGVDAYIDSLPAWQQAALKLTGDDAAVRPVAIDERSPTGCGACRGSRRRLAEPVKPDETGWERIW